MEPIGGIKVFKLEEGEYWAGPNLEECIEEYQFWNGDDGDEMLEAPVELTEADLDRLRFTEGPDGEATDETFRQRLEEMVRDGEYFPSMFATTEV